MLAPDIGCPDVSEKTAAVQPRHRMRKYGKSMHKNTKKYDFRQRWGKLGKTKVRVMPYNPE